ncbi:MAG: type II toxin-antitoxin system PemK/MazF family toxin [Xenococcaceae cyanobacterium]
MTIKRGELWLADLNPTRGSEQGGTRPVIIFQNDIDRTRLERKLGELNPETLTNLEGKVLLTLGYNL